MTSFTKIPFFHFQNAIEIQFNLMQAEASTFVFADVSGDSLWSNYIASFPEGTNPLFRERTEYECNCCRNFVRNLGGLIGITNSGKVISIWDLVILQPNSYYQVVADKMSAYVKSVGFREYFNVTERAYGSRPNKDNSTDIVWNHFYLYLPKAFVVAGKDIGPLQNNLNTDRSVFERSMKEFTVDAAETILELISQNSLYRGAEHKAAVTKFLTYKRQYDALQTAAEKNIFVWTQAKALGFAGRFRATVIGTLLEDLSQGVELEHAVKSFEQKVAPLNYKRTTSLVTPQMIKQAQAKVEELGIQDSLARTFAKQEDIPLAHTLFTASVKQSLNLFDDLAEQAKVNVKPKNFANIEEISLEKFLKDVVPTAKQIEVLVENKHTPSFMSIMAPVVKESPNILNWSVPLSWTYAGNITDSIQERVKKAGGAVNGVMRASLSWFNYDDLDISVIEPNRNRIYFGDKISYTTGGRLDVDMNAGGGSSREAVENISWPSLQKLQKGSYLVVVKNFRQRETVDFGFNLQIQLGDQLFDFSHSGSVGDGKSVEVLTIVYDGANFKITNVNPALSGGNVSKTVWNVSTETFVPVEKIFHSPNYWDENPKGNKHTFFILKDCKNPDSARGFYNEFLKPELTPHRKVFELLAAKTIAQPTENQVSGLGFSATKPASLVVKVTGQIQRTLIVKI